MSRLTKSVNGSVTQTFTFDANDRVTNSGYNYDNDGNVLNDPTNTYTWDWENKLVGTNAGRSNAATYVSDYDGIRVQQTTSAGTTNYTVDPESGYGNVIEERGATGTLNARYDYGDDLVRMDRGSGVYYYIFDGLGSTRQLTDASGNVDNTDNYDAFGNLISSTGSVVNPYLFDGQEQDGTGLYYLRARYMDPTRGEFLSQDPYAGDDQTPISLHRYLYASDDGVDRRDPSGNDDLGEELAAEGIDGEVEESQSLSIANRVFLFATNSIMSITDNAIYVQLFAASAGISLELLHYASGSLLNNLDPVRLVNGNPGDFVEKKVGANATGYEIIDDFRNGTVTAIRTSYKTQPRVLDAIQQEAETLSSRTQDFQQRNNLPAGTLPPIPASSNKALLYVIPENYEDWLDDPAFVDTVSNISDETEVAISVVPLQGWINE